MLDLTDHKERAAIRLEIRLATSYEGDRGLVVSIVLGMLIASLVGFVAGLTFLLLGVGVICSVFCFVLLSDRLDASRPTLVGLLLLDLGFAIGATLRVLLV